LNIITLPKHFNGRDAEEVFFSWKAQTLGQIKRNAWVPFSAMGGSDSVQTRKSRESLTIRAIHGFSCKSSEDYNDIDIYYLTEELTSQLYYNTLKYMNFMYYNTEKTAYAIQ